MDPVRGHRERPEVDERVAEPSRRDEELPPLLPFARHAVVTLTERDADVINRALCRSEEGHPRSA
jgi:hypothetical protein